MNLINYWWIQLTISEFTYLYQLIFIYYGVAHFHYGKFVQFHLKSSETHNEFRCMLM
jgi:hypothetical protein